MNDKELLEQAAKAAGMKYEPVGCFLDWNPLTNDGDALRLAVKLRLDIEYGAESVFANGEDVQNHQLFEWHNDDPYAATRRAIVRAAAEIGKTI